MQNNLVIVESPKKAELIQGFLNKKKLTGYTVMASAGHVRDLKQKAFSVDLANDYAPEYEISEDKRALVRSLKAAAKRADLVFLASDEDREGEAIAWHLSQALDLDPAKTRRIVFHEITSEAFLHALEHPRSIDQDLVDAQQARRVLDRIVGFELSPVLWRRIRRSLSAGRVQSVAARLVVDREREINAFVSSSSFRVQAEFALEGGASLSAELNHRFEEEAEASTFLSLCSGQAFSIGSISRRSGKRSPAAPFTTSTLQQEAAHKFGYSVTQTMRLAQSLYESGHITYMRTDSVSLSSMAMGAIAEVVKTTYGERYYQARKYQTKSKGAQEAHEAIRPTYMDKEAISGTPQEQRLYQLIRRRTLASQMADAELERTTVSIPVSGSPHSFVAQGEVVIFKGFLELYMESSGEDEPVATSAAKLLPPLSEDQALTLSQLDAVERFAQRPARYTEASMVSKLEELGIGRPSTYAPTIQTIQARGYVERADREGRERRFVELRLEEGQIRRSERTELYGADKGKLIPTDIGIVVNDFLVEQFPRIVDYNFTARVEEGFDQVAEGAMRWQDLIDEFYQDFHPAVEQASERHEGEQRVGTRLLGTDPATGKPVSATIGRYGAMVMIGSAEDEDKPRFASLRTGQQLDTITLSEALKLFELPRQLGLYQDKVVTVAIGRFGPYVRHDGKFASLPKEADPMTITLAEAIELMEAKQEAERKSLLRAYDEDADLQVRSGRFGPYIKYQGANYKIPKEVEATSLSYEDCMRLIQAAPAPSARKGSRAAKTASASTPRSKTPRRAKSKA